MNIADENKLMRRVAGYHDLRMDGMTDLVIRARGHSVMDIGCNRGLVSFEFANNGAAKVHGVDFFAEGIETARQLFADLRNVESRFEVADLTKGPKALEAFGRQQYDIVLMLATYHKLKRVTKASDLTALMKDLGERTRKWFAWRGTSDKANENEGEMVQIDRDFHSLGLRRVHTSHLSLTLGVCAIWSRQ